VTIGLENTVHSGGETPGGTHKAESGYYLPSTGLEGIQPVYTDDGKGSYYGPAQSVYTDDGKGSYYGSIQYTFSPQDTSSERVDIETESTKASGKKTGGGRQEADDEGSSITLLIVCIIVMVVFIICYTGLVYKENGLRKKRLQQIQKLKEEKKKPKEEKQ
jgi:hypothetical protein